MKDDATEAALGLLGLNNASSSSTIPLKRAAPDDVLEKDPDEQNSNPDSIKCICGSTYDDGFSIACDNCSRWCHAACFDIVEGGVPEEWHCWVCVPRPVDRERAARLQRDRQREAIRNEVERRRRHASPGTERKQRRASTAAVEANSHTGKRKRRTSVNVQSQPAEDEHVDIDEPWTHSYVHIDRNNIPHQETRDRLRRQAQHWRGVTALSSSTSPSPFDTSPVSLGAFPDSPQTMLRPLSDSSFSHPTLSSNTNPSVRPPSYAMHTTHPIPSSKFITPFTSTIIPSSAYLSDPLNAYVHQGMPKPFVHLFGPPLDVALDARIEGNEARFVRSGCKPNAVLRPVICEHASKDPEDPLTFGVFALRDLKPNEEIVLGWEWDDGNAVHSLPALIENPRLFSARQVHHLRNQMTSMLHALSSTFTTCACGAKAKDCALTLMAAFVDGQLPDHSCTERSPCSPHPSSAKADLGPLVGVERGFRTREKMPWSGGMNGVELMIPPQPMAGPSTVLSDRRNTVGNANGSMLAKQMLPEFRLSPATDSPTPKKDRKGKGRTHAIQSDDSDTSVTNEHKSPKPKRRHRRVTIDSSPYRSPSPTDLADEDRMPPKMRKQWIHRSSEALRNASLTASPSESVVSLGSVLGSVGADKMDVDSDARDMPPPPMPASHDSSSSSHSPRIFTNTRPLDIPFQSVPKLPDPPPSPSPSTPFANLSLHSPTILASSSVPVPSHSHTHTHPLRPRFFPDSGPNDPSSSPAPAIPASPFVPSTDPSSIPSKLSNSSAPFYIPMSKVSEVNLAEMDQTEDGRDESSEVPMPDGGGGDLMDVDEEKNGTGKSEEMRESESLPRSRLMETSAPDVFVLLRSPRVSLPPPTPPTPLESDAAHDHVPPIPAATDSDNRPHALAYTTSEIADTTTSPSAFAHAATTTKSEANLQDFKLRKQKQKEEQMARAAKPPEVTVAELTDISLGTNEGQHEQLMKDPGADTSGIEVEADLEAVMSTYRSQAADGETKAVDNLVSNGAHGGDISLFDERAPVNGAQISHQNSPPHPNQEATSLMTKIELIEDCRPLSHGVTMDSCTSPEHDRNPETSVVVEASQSERKMNGAAMAMSASLSGGETPASSPPPGKSDSASSRLSTTSSSQSQNGSQEDGEIVNSASPHYTPFLVRSHSPPTQPRSFNNISSALPRSVPRPNPPASRPLPSGPRALRAMGGNVTGTSSVYPPSRSLPFGSSQYIPRGPSADRERKDWERERGWVGVPRGRGRGSAGWGR